MSSLKSPETTIKVRGSDQVNWKSTENTAMAPITDEEYTTLKPWLMARAAKESEAEPDVLADYILALLHNKIDDSEMVKLLSSSLEDFMDKSPEAFAKEIVECVASKSHTKSAATPATAEELKKTNKQEALRVTQEFFKKDDTSYNQAPPDYKRKQRRGPPVHTPRPPLEQIQAERESQKTHLETVAVEGRVPRGKEVVISNLPLDKLEDAKLRSYFTRFGEITNVKVNAEFRVAEIEFANDKAARKAWSNPTPIFDNRFIKIFYKKAEEKPAPFDLDAFKLQQIKKQKEFEEKQAKKKERDDKLKQLIALKERMLTGFEKELSQLEETLKANPEEEGAIRIRVEAIQKEMEQNQVTPDAIAQDKARLEGKTSVFTPRGRGRAIGRGSMRGRGRGGAPYSKRPSVNSASRSLDLRTKTIKITNLTDPQNESFQRALGVFGKDSIVEVKSKGSSSVHVTFKDRYLAEKFFNEKVELEGQAELQKAWDETARPTLPSNTENVGSASAEIPTDVVSGAPDVEMN